MHVEKQEARRADAAPPDGQLSISLTGSIKERLDRGLAPCEGFLVHSL